MNKILLTASILISTTATAQQELSPPENQTPQIKHTSKESALKAAGLETYATSSNDEIIEKTSKQINKIKEDLGDGFGGSWIEYDKNNQAYLAIGISGETATVYSHKNGQPTNERIIFIPVNYGINYLNSLEQKIADAFKEIKQGGEPIVLSLGIDEPRNKIVVRGRKENFQYIEDIIRRMGFDFNIIIIEEQNGPVELFGNIYGGTKIGATYDGTQEMFVCTTGFNVVISNIYPGSITAAHCYNDNKIREFVHFNLGSSPTGSIKGPHIGQFFADGWPDAMDAVIFGNTNFVHTLHRQIITTGNNVANVRPVATALPSSIVCTSGGTNGWRCGVLTNPRVRHLIKGKDFFLSEFSVCGSHGDSGGPVVSNNFNALGIYMGSVGYFPNGTCGAVMGGSAPPTSIYQPLGPYLSKYDNVQILAN